MLLILMILYNAIDINGTIQCYWYDGYYTMLLILMILYNAIDINDTIQCYWY